MLHMPPAVYIPYSATGTSLYTRLGRYFISISGSYFLYREFEEMIATL